MLDTQSLQDQIHDLQVLLLGPEPGIITCKSCNGPFRRALCLTRGDGKFWYSCPQCYEDIAYEQVRDALLEINKVSLEKGNSNEYGSEQFSDDFREYRRITQPEFPS